MVGGPRKTKKLYLPRPHWWHLVDVLDAENFTSETENEHTKVSMQTRRAHKKSRNGCGSCKRRRVKCDERGPPCGQCAVKRLDCAYSDPKQAGSQNSGDDEPAAASLPGTSPTPRSPPPSPPTVQPSPSPASSRRLLELELMNQWSAETYKSLCGTATEEFHTWQVLVPREGLRYDYLLHGILALSALEIAMASPNGQSSEYVNTALEYQNLASSSFRAELSNVTEANSQAVFAFSLITMILSLALPQFVTDDCEPISMLDNMVLHYELIRGVGLIVQSSRDWLEAGPLLRNAERFNSLPIADLDTDTQAAIDRLNAVNDEKHDLGRADSRPAKAQAMTWHAACRKAIFYLEECFARCIEPLQRGYALAWLGLAGPEYVSAIKQKNPVALLIMMHWGVLAERSSHGVWWAQSAGKSLVDEISRAVADEDDSAFNAALAWARQEVGWQESFPTDVPIAVE